MSLVPNNEEHALDTYKRYGVWGYDLHKWMDVPSKEHGPNHRVFRHDSKKPPPISAIKKYGYEMARKMQLAHLRLDGVYYGKPPVLPIWQEGEWLYKRMPDGKVYRKKLSTIKRE